MKLVVAVGGASGSIYAKRLLDTLVPLAPSARGRPGVHRRRQRGLGARDRRRAAPTRSRSTACATSGRRSRRDRPGWDAMVVIPCSTGGLARIAHGISDDLVGRAADVMLKERRKLVLVVRETPLSAIHLENMLAVTRAGAVVLPASPSFYSKPSTMDAVLDTVVGRVLDQLGLPNTLMPRWGEKEPRNRRRQVSASATEDSRPARRRPRRWPRWICSPSAVRPPRRATRAGTGAGSSCARARQAGPDRARSRSRTARATRSASRAWRRSRRPRPPPWGIMPAPVGEPFGLDTLRCFALCRLALPRVAAPAGRRDARWDRASRRWRSGSAPTSCTRRSSPSARCASAPTPTTRR